MTILKDLTTGDEQDVPMATANLQQFIAQYDSKFVEGYLSAIADVFKGMDEAMWEWMTENSRHMYSPAVLRKNIITFHDQKYDLLTAATANGLSFPSSPNPTVT